MPSVRERNESAWLLPNDGSRTNHRLRRDMRRYADEDQIDLVIVGCGGQRAADPGQREPGADDHGGGRAGGRPTGGRGPLGADLRSGGTGA